MPGSSTADVSYRGRIAPSPTGYLHLGHARTFWIAHERVRQHGGVLVFRNEDLDGDRCRAGFATAMMDDLRWFGLEWAEGPDRGGAFGPYTQTDRLRCYERAFRRLQEQGLVYPCRCSRRDVQRALQAPHAGDEEPLYPGTCRPAELQPDRRSPGRTEGTAANVSWRYRVPAGEPIAFVDGAAGPQSFVAGKDFGDFVVWRQDGLPSYQFAVVVDDAAMRITEVVRGRDLLLSTARQLLIYRALGHAPPAFFHCPLLLDEAGVRLAKRHDALSLRHLRGQGWTPETLRSSEAFIAAHTSE